MGKLETLRDLERETSAELSELHASRPADAVEADCMRVRERLLLDRLVLLRGILEELKSESTRAKGVEILAGGEEYRPLHSTDTRLVKRISDMEYALSSTLRLRTVGAHHAVFDRFWRLVSAGHLLGLREEVRALTERLEAPIAQAVGISEFEFLEGASIVVDRMGVASKIDVSGLRFSLDRSKSDADEPVTLKVKPVYEEYGSHMIVQQNFRVSPGGAAGADDSCRRLPAGQYALVTLSDLNDYREFRERSEHFSGNLQVRATDRENEFNLQQYVTIHDKLLDEKIMVDEDWVLIKASSLQRERKLRRLLPAEDE